MRCKFLKWREMLIIVKNNSRISGFMESSINGKEEIQKLLLQNDSVKF